MSSPRCSCVGRCGGHRRWCTNHDGDRLGGKLLMVLVDGYREMWCRSCLKNRRVPLAKPVPDVREETWQPYKE